MTILLLKSINQSIKYLLLVTDKRNHSSWKKTQEKMVIHTIHTNIISTLRALNILGNTVCTIALPSGS